MGQVQQRVLKWCVTIILAVCVAVPLCARRFYPDDPLERVPPPMNVDSAKLRKLSEYYDFFHHTFFQPGEKNESVPVPAQGVNTLGEVPDSNWFTNRHGRKRLTTAELVRGPGTENLPATDRPWRVVGGKSEGITPGLTIEDSRGRKYLLKFDPLTAPELATAADVIGARLFHAIGYYTPENYIVRFVREQLRVDPKAEIVDQRGVERPMREKDVDALLTKVPRDSDGRYRGLASFFLEGEPLGPFRYYGTRTDDPNDIYRHEHRRELRGLYVFASWLNHTDAKSLNSLDTLIKEGGRQYIRHHLIDFGAILGSDSFVAKSPRSGNVHLFEWGSSARQFFSLGLYTPDWMRAHYPELPGVGRIESEVFQPDRWKPNYYNPAFANCLPEDAFWAAKIVMSFRDEDIRALVDTGEYSDPASAEYLVRTLIERRDKIGRVWFSKVLPLDTIRIDQGRLAFDDLSVRYGFTPERSYQVSWARFDNEREAVIPISHSGWQIPDGAGDYMVAKVSTESKTASLYIRSNGKHPEVVGIERQ